MTRIKIKLSQRDLKGIKKLIKTVLVCSPPPEGYARWALDLTKIECIKNKTVEAISKIQAIPQEHELKS